MKYRVNEIFHTIQGEGMHSGLPATFIRLQGCTVGCPWCDTKYTWKKGGTSMETEDIVAQVQHKMVVVTGGEPTIWDLDELFIALRDAGHRYHLETSGQNDYKGIHRPVWTVWSPKRNLGFKASLTVLKDVSEVKFVVDEELTLEEVWDCLDPVFAMWQAYASHPTITLMPEGCPPSLESMQKAYTFTQALTELTTRPVRFSDRLQYRLGVK